ncbi:PREDICTED: ENHANCER OF AG-4 protein 2-like [Nelumbo nucifera]|uniref:ENHANCER OF AG-4 protein 2-like n=1 Tax=Nelumbo nucifera TaxID=4432 RepID=A0A1U8Q9P0_NELNU|nr:PREDICTED: ENHANCER OF AG-4 protein 2-like [Nelumbo nucifera]
MSPFPLPPRVFGCVYFVHNLGPGTNKLDARSLKCIFLGYSRTQKWYKCYHPSSRRSLLCADVTFFEFTPFFVGSGDAASSTSPPPLPLLVADPPPLIPVVPTSLPPVPPSVDCPPIRHVYTHRPRVPAATPPASSPSTDPAPDPTPASALDLPIALRKVHLFVILSGCS